MAIEDTLFQFASGESAGAIVLRGRWGVGKTHFWKQRIVPRVLKSAVPRRRKRYSYVSMFGIQSIEDLKAAIFQAGAEFDGGLPESKWRFVNPGWMWWKAKQLMPFALEGADFPYVRGGLGRSYNALTFYTIRDRLICIDDIERRGSQLRLLDVLGLVSHLAEQRSCRVVVILNSDELHGDDEKTWNSQKEKVFLGEMIFSPSLEECIDLGLTSAQQEPWTALARECLLKLQVSNIRIVARATRSIRAALNASTLRPLAQETLDRLVRVLVMLEYADNGRGEGAPPLEMVLGTGRWATLAVGMRDEDQTEEEQIWTKEIKDYGVYFGDELDLALANLVKAGFPDTEELDRAIRSFEGRSKSTAEREEFSRSWRLYHDTLVDNTEELLDTFERTWPPVSGTESVENLAPLVKIFRLLGRPAVATRFIHEWVEQRKGDRVDELDPDQTYFFGPMEDEEIIEAMRAAYVTETDSLDLTAAIQAMGKDHGINQAAIDTIAAADVAEIVDVLEANPGRYLSNAIKHALQLADHPQQPAWAQARESMKRALVELASRNPINEVRVRNKFGIDPAVGRHSNPA